MFHYGRNFFFPERVEKVQCERNNGTQYNEEDIVYKISYISKFTFFYISITACKISSSSKKTFTNSTVEEFYRN